MNGKFVQKGLLVFHILRCRQHIVNKWITTPRRPFWRIYWNSTEGALIRYNDKEIYLDEDTLVCIPPALSVDQVLLKPFEHLWFHVDTPLFSDYELKVYQFEVDTPLKKRLKMLEKLFASGDENSSQAQNLKQLIIYWFMTGMEIDGSIISREVTDLVRKAIHIMEERLQSGISTEELAKNLSISSKTLNRQFKKHIGLPPHKFLTGLRIKKAAALLFSRDLSLDEISYRCGFCNRSHFSRAFRESFNQSPAAFRRDQSG